MGSGALSLILLLMSFIHAGLSQERPKAVLKVSPDERVFRGETVTLTCDIQRAGDIQWTYSWFKDGYTFYPYTTTTAEISFTADEYKGGEYSCKGDTYSQRSHTSAAVTLTVSDLPRSALTVTPDSPVFTGERVNLKCVIETHSDWRYEWHKVNTFNSVMLQTSDRYTVNRDTLTIRGVITSDQSYYRCRGQIRSVSSQSSSAVSLSVKDSPRSTLTVTPDSPVFTGETVNLKCVIETYSNWRQRNGLIYDRRYEWTPEWRYEWRKGSTYSSVMLETFDRYTVNRDTLTIRGVITSDQDQYWCRGQRDERPNSSQSNPAVYLSVKDSPRSTLTVTPDSPVFTGETVNLTCVIETYSNWKWRIDRTYGWTSDWTYYQTPEWRYEWFKDSVMLQTSDHYTVNRDTLTIRGVITSDQDQYWCRGQRDKRPNSSQSRSAVNLTVMDSPRSTLTVTPDSPVFTGETVTLKCVIETHSDWRRRIDQTYGWRSDWRYYQTAEWRYEWYKDSVMLQSSDRYTVNRDTLTIRGVITSDQDQYWCRGQRDKRPTSSQSRSVVNLTVMDLPRSSLTVTPDSPVFTGETVTLKCVIESHSDWRYEWYKDSVMLQSSDRYTVNRDTLSIKAQNESDQDQYWCRGQRDERPNSSKESNRIHLSVKASSSLLVTAVVLGLLCLLIFISLLLLWRYKKNKDQQRNINQTSVPNQSAESQPENSPLQSGPDHIYDDVTEVKKRHKDDPESFLEVTYSEVLWSYLDKDVSMAESNDVTYSEVITKVKKCKDADAGVGDATYASVRKKGP